MDSLVFAAVLFAAACHAGWNAVIKVGMEPLRAARILAALMIVIGLVLAQLQ